MQDDLQTLAGSSRVPVEDRLTLDINRLLVKRPGSTYMFKIAGHHWADQGIFDGDVAVIDRSVEPSPNDLVIAWRTDGSAICRQRHLAPEDKVWGVITATIHGLRP